MRIRNTIIDNCAVPGSGTKSYRYESLIQKVKRIGSRIRNSSVERLPVSSLKGPDEIVTNCFNLGRAFMPDEDENTCAVQLIYKNQEPQPPADDDSVFLPPKQPDGPVKSPLSPIVETSR
jgi:hypothetical protein